MADHFAGYPNRIGANMDLTSLSDDDLAAHHIAVVSARYLDDGGDPNLLPTRP